MSANTREMLHSILAVHYRHREQPPARLEAWHEGQRAWREWYRIGQSESWGTEGGGQQMQADRPGLTAASKTALERARCRFYQYLSRLSGRRPIPLGAVDFGNFDRTDPISLDFGWDRGTPIDRYYIEAFLSRHASDIAGRVLEMGDDLYSRTYGGSKISKQDVLHLNRESPNATLLGDLTTPGVVPENAFDCIVFTQTLQIIFQLEKAVARLHAALKPNGILLLTAPGISQIDRGEWNEQWSWSFTAKSLRRLFEGKFAASEIDVDSFGNVYAATAFLQGVAIEEVAHAKLDIRDPAYPVILALRARKL